MAASSVQPLIDQVRANSDGVDSAVVWINGSHDRMQAAVDAALANGATAAELLPLTDELALQKTKVQLVAEAIAANTPLATAKKKP